MFEGAVLLRGVLLGVLSHSSHAESVGALRWEEQCETMLVAAGGRASAASSAAAVQCGAGNEHIRAQSPADAREE